jgi:hypothetical protein
MTELIITKKVTRCKHYDGLLLGGSGFLLIKLHGVSTKKAVMLMEAA